MAQLVGVVVAQLVWSCGGSVDGGGVTPSVDLWWLSWWRCGGSVSEGVVAQLVVGVVA